MPLQNSHSKMEQLIAHSFQLMRFDDLLHQAPEQFTLASCSSIFRRVSIHLKQRKPLTPALQRLLMLVFKHFSDPALVGPIGLKWIEQERLPGNTLAFIWYNLGCIVDEYAKKRQQSSASLPMIAIPTVNWLINQMMHYPLQSKNIGTSLHGLGRLAERGQLQGKLDSRLLSNLLDRLKHCRDINAQAIANSLHGLGRLAEHGKLQGTLDGQLITDLLERLKHCHGIDAQAIANSLHALGRLAEHGQLQENMDGQLLIDLLERLIVFSDIQSQNISNSLHGLGRLADQGKLQGSMDGRLLTDLLERLKRCHDIDTRAIGSCLHGLGRLAEHGQLQGSMDSRLVTDLLEQLNNCRDLDAQAIANSLHGIGRLAEQGKLQGTLDGMLLTDLLKQLKQCRDIQAQNISNSLHGLGRLAEQGQLQGTLDGMLLTSLLHRLNHCRDIKAQNIGNSLHALGRLAEHGLLQGTLDARLVTDLLEQLKRCHDIDAQAIGNSLHGIGRLAEQGKLQGTLDGMLLTDLLKQLKQCRDIQAQNISNSLHGLGRLAAHGQLQGNLDDQQIKDLLIQLKICKKIKAQNISSSLHAIGRLVEHGQLQGNLDGRLTTDLLEQLKLCRDINTQEIGNSLHGLGRLAEHGTLQGSIDCRLLTDLLALLNNCHDIDIDAQAIGNSLHGLGRLAEQGKLQGTMDAMLFTDLLKQLKQCSDIQAHNISNSLHGLGRLAKHGHLQYKLEGRLLTDLLNRLYRCPDLNAQTISNSLHGLGRLAEHRQLQGNLDVSDLLERLNHCPDLNVQAISNSLHSFGWLIHYHNGTTLIDSSVITSLLSQFFSLNPHLIGCDQVLFGLSSLVYQGLNPHHVISKEQVLILMNTVLSGTYIHPSRAAVLLHALISFRFHTPELNEVFERLMDAVECISALRLPPRVLRQLEQDKDALSFAPRWLARVQQYVAPPVAPQRATPAFFSSPPSPQPFAGQRRPRPSIEHMEPPRKRRALSVQTANTDSEWIRASRNALFQAISNENLIELRALLDLIAAPRHASSGTRTRTATTNRTHTEVRHRVTAATTMENQAEQRVNQFLMDTPANALRRLISQSSSKYFISLLEACSVHGRFVLAKQHHLNLIIIHLPFDSLSSFIAALLPLQLYRDHQALLALLDALTIRLDQNQDEHEAIVTLQKQLINRGLEFHRECRHHRVVERLEVREQAINNNTIVLEDTEELATVSSVLPVARQQPVPTTPVFVRSSAIVVATPSVVSESLPIRSSVNPSYLYTAEDIDALLRIRLNTRPEIQILAATHLRADAPVNLIEVLRQFIEHPDNTTAPCTALVPIEVGEHWIGVKLVFNNNKITQMVYFNSMETEGSPHRHTIVNQLHSAQLLAPGFRSFTNDNELRQLNSFDCGPLLIENMRSDCCNNYWQKPPSNGALERLAGIIRQKHFDLLAQENPLHFETFKNQDNEQTPAVSVQLNRHNQVAFFNNNNNPMPIAEQSTSIRSP